MQSGKYVFAMTLAETQLQITILARKYYTGAQHVTLTTDAGRLRDSENGRCEGGGFLLCRKNCRYGVPVFV